MIPYHIIQAIGLIAFLISMLGYWNQRKGQILKFQIIAGFFYIVHYFLLGAANGAIVSIIGLGRDFLFSKIKERNRVKKVLIILLAIYVFLGIVSYSGIMSLLPILASITYSSFLLGNEICLTIGALLDSLLWLGYDMYSGSISGVLTDSVNILSTTLSLLKRISLKRKKVEK